MIRTIRRKARQLRHRAGFCGQCWRRYIAVAETTGRADGVVVFTETIGVCPKHLDSLFEEVERVGWEEMTATLDNGAQVSFRPDPEDDEL